MGFTVNADSFSLSSIDWKTWAVVALVAVIVYQWFFGEKAANRRRALAQARASYKGQVAKIKAGYR